MTIIRTTLVCLLFAGFVFGQANSQPATPLPNSPVQELPNAADKSATSPDTPVITVQGVCDKQSAAADCKTVITRAEWEKLISALQPNMPKSAQKQLAARYVQAVILANKAHEMGLDKGPVYEEQMYLARLQLLARLAGEQIQKDASKVSDADIENYYRQHSGEFNTISYDKIYVPKQKQGTTPSSATGRAFFRQKLARTISLIREAIF